MPADERFYERFEPLAPEKLADLTQSRLERGARAPAFLLDADSLQRAGPQTVTFCQGAEAARTLPQTGAGAVFVTEALIDDCLASGACALIHSHPEAAFAAALDALFRPRSDVFEGPGIAESAEIAGHVKLAHGVTVGPGAKLGEGVEIGPGAAIGPGVQIGAGGRIGGGARIGFSLIGENANIGANNVIGGAGFGVIASPGGLLDAPHIGRIVIGDNVRIGALCTIDRGRLDDTVIGDSAKMDSHCHIAHNVRIGARCVMAAYAGISGSCVIGDDVMMGGRVGLADHVTIGNAARIAAGSVILSDVPAGETWMGYPAKPSRAFLRETMTLQKLAGTRKKDAT